MTNQLHSPALAEPEPKAEPGTAHGSGYFWARKETAGARLYLPRVEPLSWGGLGALWLAYKAQFALIGPFSSPGEAYFESIVWAWARPTGMSQCRFVDDRWDFVCHREAQHEGAHCAFDAIDSWLYLTLLFSDEGRQHYMSAVNSECTVDRAKRLEQKLAGRGFDSRIHERKLLASELVT